MIFQEEQLSFICLENGQQMSAIPRLLLSLLGIDLVSELFQGFILYPFFLSTLS